MKKSILATLIATSLIATPMVQASEQNNHKEEIGFGTGAVIGFIFGGPAGAFITGLAGSLIAKTDNQKQHNEALTAKLSSVTSQQQAQYAKYQQELQKMAQNYQQELLAQEQSYQSVSKLQLDNLLMSLQFKTGSSTIENYYQPQLTALAKILSKSPNVAIDLSGYTDLQGNEAQNQKLSLARVNSVKQALINQGVAPERISLFALGESEPVVANSQNPVSFYDRRVVIKLHQPNTATAKN